MKKINVKNNIFDIYFFIYIIKKIMKTTKTYSIDESLYRAFDLITTERNINKSSFIEDYIKKFIKDNGMDYVDKLYVLRENPNHIVRVLSQDNTYYLLDDGSKIQKILFMQIFKESESINPDEFFNKSAPILENIVNKIKNIDESKITNQESLVIKGFDNNGFKLDTDNNFGRDSELLNEINNIYKSKKYLNMSKIELCEIIIKLRSINFEFDSEEYKLQKFLISIFSDLKDLALS